MPKGIVETDLPKISALLEQVIGHSDYTDIQRMGGLTNRTYQTQLCRRCTICTPHSRRRHGRNDRQR